MSSIEKKLEEKLQNIKNIINTRKNEANNLELPGRILQVVKVYGEHSDWAGGEYNFHEKGLSIKYSCHNQQYLQVDLGHETTDVFRGEYLRNMVANIDLYIPGDWEKRINELFDKIPEVEEKRRKRNNIEELKYEIKKLTKEWQLEDLP